MSATDLEATLTRLSHFTNPPADAFREALDAYAAHVEELEAEIASLNTRIGEEVSFQRFIRQSEKETRAELTKRNEEERRKLVKEIGFAAIIRDRALTAHWQGRKTVKVDALLEGRPADEEAA